MASKDESSDTWFEGGASEPAEAATFDDAGVRYLGAELIGKGSMGKVLSVRDTHLGRRVAYKQLRETMRGGSTVSEDVKARFIREARITARLGHPGIVAVHDIGRTPEGGLYYTMRYVHGQTFERALDEATDLPVRLTLLPRLLDACQAIAYAHARDVVHRDLKPANIVLGEFGETVVVDWGLAKELNEDALDLTGHATSSASFSESTETSHGSVLGTPAYMSPEQASGQTATADARSDVWSLGAILFEILAGRRLVADADPKLAVERVRSGALPDPGQAAPRAPAELVAICRRALAQDPASRYPNAARLARDIEAFQSGELVRAYAYSPMERFRRTVQRYRLLLGVTAAAGLTVAAVITGSFQTVVTERDRAREAEAQGQRHLAAALERGATTALSEGQSLEAEAFAVAALSRDEGPKSRGVLAAVRASRPPERTETWGVGCRDLTSEGDALFCSTAEGLQQLAPVHTTLIAEPVRRMTAKGGRIAAHLPEALVVLDDGVETYRVPMGQGPAPAYPHLLDDGRVIAAERGQVILLDASGQVVWKTKGTADISMLALHEGGIIALTSSRGIRRIDLETGEQLAVRGHITNQGTFAGVLTTDSILVGGGTGELFQLNFDFTTRRIVELGAPLLELAHSSDGTRLAATFEDQSIAILDAKTLDVLFRLRNTDATSPSVTWFDGDLVTGDSQQVQRWDVTALRPRVYTNPEGIADVAFSEDGLSFAAADGAGTVSVFDTTTGTLKTTFSAGEGVSTCVAWGSGDTLFVGNVYTGLVSYRGSTGEKVESLPGVGGWPRSLEWTAESGLLAVYQHPELRQYKSGEPPKSPAKDPDDVRLWELEVSPDGSHAAWTNAEDRITVVSLPDFETVWEPDLPEAPRSMAVSPGGELMALSTPDQNIDVLRIGTGEVVAHFQSDSYVIDNLEFSSDGDLLATAGWDRTARIYSISEGRQLAILEGHTHRVSDVEFSPDDRTLLTGSWDYTARLWDLTDLRTDGGQLVEDVARLRGIRVEGARLVPANTTTHAKPR